ncbi:MAG: aldo/keto reductase [Spirochaetia bacterium]|nr:aldo/keto reductase [Spirochaetia bacterium]
MQYRAFGKDGWKISALGFGAMRLPMMPDGRRVDEKEAIRIMRYGIDKGINYIDTAYFYHDGLSETIVGKMLKDGYRNKVRVATKSPVGLIKKPEDFDRILDEQLMRLDIDAIDNYLFHGIGDGGLSDIKKHDLFAKAEAAKAAGKIRHIGFSFHDKADAFIRVIDSYDKWEFCQIQYNYMDENNQAGTAGLKYAASKGLPVIVMEPLLGGKLARPPEDIKKMFSGYIIQRTPAEWGLQWVWNHPEVSVILSGMSKFEQVEENIKSANRSGANRLSGGELELISRAGEAFAKRQVIPCTKCEYCMPCPQGVAIPRNFELYNEGVIYGDPGGSRYAYKTWIKPENMASACISCKICEEKCPQKIDISSWMTKVAAVLGDDKPYPG